MKEMTEKIQDIEGNYEGKKLQIEMQDSFPTADVDHHVCFRVADSINHPHYEIERRFVKAISRIGQVPPPQFYLNSSQHDLSRLHIDDDCIVYLRDQCRVDPKHLDKGDISGGREEGFEGTA